MKPKSISLTMQELLTVVESEALQLDDYNREKVLFSIQKKTDWETGEEIFRVKVLREEIKND